MAERDDSSPSSPQFGDRRSSSEEASRAMRRNRSQDTEPELLLRRELWRRGLRYRLHTSGLPGRPDLVFRRERVAVFCDGDFWHGKDWPERKKRLAKGNNPDYWIPKIRANMARDCENEAELRALGWTVLRYWESDIKADVEAVADQVQSAVSATRE